MKLRSDQQLQQILVEKIRIQLLKKRLGFAYLPLDDLVEAARQTAAVTAAQQQDCVVVVVEDQVQDGFGFHPHGGFQTGQPLTRRVMPVLHFGVLKCLLDFG